MRHRMGNIHTGLGDSSRCLLPNTWCNNERLNKVANLMLEEALNLKYISEYGGLDFKVEVKDNEFNIDFGFEPAYQHDELFLYHIENNKNNCSMKMGIARGVYGSEIEIIKNVNYDKSDIEFKELIDKWHDKLLECIV